MSIEAPSYYNQQDRALYMKLYYTGIDRELTPQEKEFCRMMYYQEEYASGLDGDRD